MQFLNLHYTILIYYDEEVYKWRKKLDRLQLG